MKRALLRFVAWVAGLTLLAACVAAAVNASDQERLPDDPALVVSRRPVVPDDNAYFLLVGFEAPRDVDPIAHGARLVREHDEEAAQDPSMRSRADAIGARGAKPEDGGLRYVGDGPAHCAFATAACRDAIASRSTQIEGSLRTTYGAVPCAAGRVRKPRTGLRRHGRSLCAGEVLGA